VLTLMPGNSMRVQHCSGWRLFHDIFAREIAAALLEDVHSILAVLFIGRSRYAAILASENICRETGGQPEQC